MQEFKQHSKRFVILLASIGATAPVHATNGMSLEGYGPISTGMGGISQAIEHGTAAMMANPATLALIPAESLLEIALGELGPRIEVSGGGMTARSLGRSYVMPAVGYVRRAHAWTYGVGVFAQGGMGAEYRADSLLAAGSGLPVRSELAVGRVIFPVAYQVTPALSLGATVDFISGSLDLQMAAPGAQFGQLVTSASGNLGAALPALATAPWARLAFSNSNRFTGSARATGWASKIGAVYKVDNLLTLGLSHHFKTALGDMRTRPSGASIAAAGGFVDNGRISVMDFQWPAMTAIGVAWQISPTWLAGVDFKRIQWSGTLRDFKMQYDSADSGGSVSFALPQQWRDQNILNLGTSWAATETLTLRGGVNLSRNPVPDELVNPLFPATIGNHVTAGLGWQLAARSKINLSVTLAPTSTVVNAQGFEIKHRQRNLQLMYSHTL
ncbi:OmpP1/FadL family transporter [Massilia sp. H6]|uniref:OmpP1/FadL family transporter n=1 Tax=Massilia sp. H6 TaxID=2970464 RepID=UPI00216A3CD5|nr:outer membrane protein transport protein [Massilia sp. H6]UVW29303.1 outer membrane protein transport protein [Massilia sp. H6]